MPKPCTHNYTPPNKHLLSMQSSICTKCRHLHHRLKTRGRFVWLDNRWINADTIGHVMPFRHGESLVDDAVLVGVGVHSVTGIVNPGLTQRRDEYVEGFVNLLMDFVSFGNMDIPSPVISMDEYVKREYGQKQMYAKLHNVTPKTVSQRLKQGCIVVNHDNEDWLFSPVHRMENETV